MSALRQPDAVPGDLVERPTIYMDVEELRTWSSHFKPGSREHGCIIRAADELESGRTAIQSLTAENATLLFKCREAEEGWKNALIAPLTWQAELTAERDAALAMVADLASELESELDAKGIYDTPRKMVRNRQTVVQARALLEGGLKP